MPDFDCDDDLEMFCDLIMSYKEKDRPKVEIYAPYIPVKVVQAQAEFLDKSNTNAYLRALAGLWDDAPVVETPKPEINPVTFQQEQPKPTTVVDLYSIKTIAD